MKASGLKEKLRRAFQTTKPSAKPANSGATKKVKQKSGESDFERFNGAAYQLVGMKIGRALPIFKDLDLNLQKAAMKTSFKAYVSLTVFTTLIAAAAVWVALPFALILVLQWALVPALLFGLGAGLLSGAGCVVGFYFYPIYQADKHKREVDDELTFTTGYMSILASAGVSPEKIFASLATLKQPLASSSEAKDVVRHINLFGLDIISALEKTSERTPSEKLREILQGIIATMHGGGNLAVYLREKFRSNIRLRKLSLKKYADTLSVMAEVYVALLLTAPLLFVIMLSVISVMGGGALGAFSSDMLLQLITYIGIPIAAIIFLIIVDSNSPKW